MTLSYKAITEIPGISDDELERYTTKKHKVTGAISTYRLVPYVYRAVRIRCNALSSVPVRIENKDSREEVEWPFEDVISPSEFLWKTEASLVIYGAAFWLKNKMGTKIVGLQYLNPSTMKVEADVDGKNLKFTQQIGERLWGPWSEDDIIYIAEYDPTQDVQPGVSPLQVALANAGLEHYMATFASLFFEHGAMPVTLLSTERPVSKEERDRTERKLIGAIAGLANAFRVRILRGGGMTQPITLTPDLDNLALKDLDEQARRKIMSALEVPITMLEDAANYATAGEHRMSFYQDTVRPRGNQIENSLNRQLFYPLNMRMTICFDELDIFQQDEASRAESLAKLVESKVPLDLAMEILGYDLTEDQWDRIKEVIERAEELTESLLGQPASPGNPPPGGQPSGQPETNQVIETAGVSKAKDRIANWPRPNQGTLEEAKRELANWQKKSLDALAKGKGAGVIWRSEYLPQEIAGNIHIGLTGALTEEDVRNVFDVAFMWLKYGT